MVYRMSDLFMKTFLAVLVFILSGGFARGVFAQDSLNVANKDSREKRFQKYSPYSCPSLISWKYMGRAYVFSDIIFSDPVAVQFTALYERKLMQGASTAMGLGLTHVRAATDFTGVTLTCFQRLAYYRLGFRYGPPNVWALTARACGTYFPASLNETGPGDPTFNYSLQPGIQLIHHWNIGLELNYGIHSDNFKSFNHSVGFGLFIAIRGRQSSGD